MYVRSLHISGSVCVDEGCGFVLLHVGKVLKVFVKCRPCGKINGKQNK